MLIDGNTRYIRSDCPCNISPDEVQWLRDNNVTTIVDLREKKEYEANPCRLETEQGFKYLHLPVTGGGDTPKSVEAVKAIYRGMLDKQMDTIISAIMNSETNVMYFCAAGKDRTGVVSAVLLKRLGFSDDAIIEDYMKTKDNLMSYLIEYVNQRPELNLDIVVPDEKYIKTVLERL